MYLSSTNTVHGKRIVKHLGLVKGNTVRARHLGRDILAILRNIIGGEISDYTKLMAEAREQALDRMIEDARSMGGNAVLHVEFGTAEIMGAAAEILVYGTAVVVEDDNVTSS
jgi:uncharacterized protein YbjQ (UPF0145 family)